MLDAIKNLFGMGVQTDYAMLVQQGAVIVDVRSAGEFAGGHINGAINIPLDRLSAGVTQIKNKQTPVITCCASGMRSASAKSVFKSMGYTEVYNGGGWTNLQAKIGR